MVELIKILITEDSGQGMVEYAFILALISLVVVSVLGFIGEALLGIFTEVKEGFPE